MRPVTSGSASTVDVTDRIELRRRTARARRVRRIAVAVVVLVLIVGAVWALGFSPLISAKKVRVSGLKTLTDDAVVTAARVPMGKALAQIDADEIARNVAALPHVASVTVRPAFPDSVRIDVVERVPAFVVKMSTGLVLVDATGSAYLPVPTAPDGVTVSHLKQLSDLDLLRDIASVVAALPEPLKKGVVTAPTRESITIAVDSGPIVMWGGAPDSQLKARVVEKLLTSVQAKVYDVSSPTRPVTRDK